MKLPNIDIDKITTLAEAKNVIEFLLQAYTEQQEEIRQLREEINRLKGQPKKPQFFSKRGHKQASVTTLLKEEGTWSKNSKKGKLAIDREERMTEVDTCACGSTSFRVLRTRRQVIQGLLFRRDNVLYRGREKQCINCGKGTNVIFQKSCKADHFHQNSPRSYHFGNMDVV